MSITLPTKHNLYMSVSGYGGIPLVTALEHFEKAEINQVQLSVGCPGPAPLDEYIHRGWKFIPHHNAPVQGKTQAINLCENYPDEYFKQVFEFCKKAKSPHYTVHGGSWDPATSNYNDASGTFLDNFISLSELGAQYGIKVGVETMYPTVRGAKHLLDSEADVYTLSLLHGSPLYRVADLAHLNIMLQAGACNRSFIDWMIEHPQTLEIHLSENDGKHDIHQAVTRDSWFWDLIKQRPDIPIVVEGRLNGLGYKTLRDNYQMALEILYG